MIRFGLCCLFVEEPVRFRTTTAASIKVLSRSKRLDKISHICLENSENLKLALSTVVRLGIGSFRICSGFFPLYTHPDVGYCLDELPDAISIGKCLSDARRFARKNKIRLSFHPDQFVVLSSHREEVAANSIRELAYQGIIAEMVGAEVINVHIGGTHGGKKEAINRFARNFEKLPVNVKKRLSVENDDVSYTPSDLAGICRGLSIPMVYDVHHHRCNPDGLSIEEASDLCIESWNRLRREPYFHISSPKDGWEGKRPRSHSDYIDRADFPRYWLKLKCRFTLDVEAKAKELAVVRLMKKITS